MYGDGNLRKDIGMTSTSFFRLLPALALLAMAAPARSDGTYFTRVGFAYEKNIHKTTNYLKGDRVPVNTEVRLLNKSGNRITIETVGTKEKVDILNIERHSRVSIDSIQARYLSAAKTPESEFTPAFLKDIEAGRVVMGMTRKDVIASVGYPPAHATASLDQNSWHYWVNRFKTTVVVFQDGKVSEVKK